MAIIESSSTPISKIKINILVYGDPGSGKSYFAATAPKNYAIIMPTETAHRALPLSGHAYGDYCIPETDADFDTILGQIEAGTRAEDAETIIWDSLTEYSDLVIAITLKNSGKTRMTLPLWGVARDYIREKVKRVNDLIKIGKHVIVLAKAQVIKDDISGKVFGAPATIGKFAGIVAGLYDIVFFADSGTKAGSYDFRLYTMKFDFTYPAKGVPGKLDLSEPNDFPTIYDKLVSEVLPNEEKGAVGIVATN